MVGTDKLPIDFRDEGMQVMSRSKRKTNRLLGYPDDARLLLINADDLGMHQDINQAVALAFEAGLVRSTSLMVPCPGASRAMQWIGENPDVCVGVHLTIVRDYAHDDWKPVALQDRVSSLLDQDGYF
ncbi:MAG: ChbG/HpnK family deacetylase [Anaerolineae bacterium]|jgi:predicted glycoside hydrolase/deacetylase ChbG (UPF0249 family)